MKDSIIAPSMMCADFLNIGKVLEEFQNSNIGYLHMDIMDGEFVPNYSLGTDFCNQLRKYSSIPLDIHLMITRPDLKLDRFSIKPGEYVSVHLESTPHIPRVLDSIHYYGAKAMVALNPATPISEIKYIVESVDGVLLMTVNPGFAGQKMLASSLRKIRDTRAYLDELGLVDVDIEVDGNVSFENAKLMREAGANIFVGGTSSVFSKENSINLNIEKMMNMIK